MANRAKGFTVVAGKRASGSSFWLVRGTRDGRQLRREFDSRQGAIAFAEQQNSELNGTLPDQSHLLTHLTREQLHSSEAVWLQLQRDFPGIELLDLLEYYRTVSPGLSREDATSIAPALARLKARYPDADLALACDWFVTHYRPAKSALKLEVALEHYLADVVRRHEKLTLSKPQFDRIGYAMQELEQHFGGDEPLANLTTSRLHAYLKETIKGRDAAGFSNKTWMNRRGYLTAFFEFCRQEGWLDSNPASGIRTYKGKELAKPAPTILDAARACELMKYLETFADGRLVPFYALCLFAGIRPDYDNGEISKLKVEHFRLKDAELKLPADITKTKRARMIRLKPNLVKWLKAYPIDRFPIIPNGFRNLHFKVRAKFKIGHDALRHTYCSMLVAKDRSVADVSLQAGNSENVIWGHYLNLVSEKEAALFWKIAPQSRR